MAQIDQPDRNRWATHREQLTIRRIMTRPHPLILLSMHEYLTDHNC
jgi:hypothetical protein